MRFDPAHRRGRSSSRSHASHLSGQALRHPGDQDRARPRRDPAASSTSAAPGSRTNGKLLEAQRLRQRTHYDIEMMREMGYCHGHRELLAHPGRQPPGATPRLPARLLPRRLPLLHRRIARDGAADRRHVRGRPLAQETLVDYGFRLPCALDNRPLRFDEFLEQRAADRLRQRHAGPVRAGATAATIVEQIIRPTGPGRSGGRGAADRGADRRPDGRDPRAAWTRTSGCWSPR